MLHHVSKQYNRTPLEWMPMRDPGGWVSLGLAWLCASTADDKLRSMVERCPDPFLAVALIARGT